ncbi:GmrSD restriction endonuclease domain-containing protein [Corynebacterium aquilae]|uniref:GmrSD restriction endonucleases N-terminal domain-containing protein n=1 Tax=Corynebacterium aquilae DSM 44791 TaxID=1431546 RepID=A0A1L7CFH8_9CORY|nr:DUF262 domain-containing protein [Corynebacterium aquilae]APT84612.1 hypothetical protein CAQU_05500 [Corynebacterium aquilae DSM 44791]
MGFSTPSYDLIDLFNRIDRGDLQLPDFQRQYLWDVDHIRALLVTVLRGYPMGALLALDTRNEPMRFRPRPLQGAPDHGVNPGLLLLDGQQRMTTLYHCLRGDGVVDTLDHRDKKIRRQFYVDINTAVSQEIMPDEAVISVSADGQVRSHFALRRFSTIDSDEHALSLGLMPVSALLSDRGSDMLFDLAGDENPQVREAAKQFNNAIAKPLVRYSVPMIRLDRETAQGGVGSIFARVNSAGLQMGIFDLLTAVFASEDPDFHLATDYEATAKLFSTHPNLSRLKRTDWLTAVSLYLTAKQGYARGQREDILRLSLEEYQAGAQRMREAFAEASTFLKQRCILDSSLVPYTFQIVPLAVILALLDERPGALANTRAWDRLNRWFWCGVFGELYGGPSVVNRAARDVIEVTEWVAAGDDQDVRVPGTVEQASFVESRLLSATRKDGLYKGIYALIMGRGARDWRTAQAFDAYSYDEMDTDFHPIFPLSYCADHGIDPVLAGSVINRTPMGRRTEVVLGGASPARYLKRVQSKSLMEDEEFDAVLATHLVNPELLHRGDAEEFFADRRSQLLEMIEHAMGATADRDVNDNDLSGGVEGPNAFA